MAVGLLSAALTAAAPAPRSVEALTKRCTDGSGGACFELGLAYDTGKGGAADPARSPDSAGPSESRLHAPEMPPRR